MSDWPTNYRDIFWDRYPNKVARPLAFAALDRAKRRGATFREILDGIDRYIETKPPERAWLNPANFLDQERYADMPAPVRGDTVCASAARDVDRLKKEIADLERDEPGYPPHIMRMPRGR